MVVLLLIVAVSVTVPWWASRNATVGALKAADQVAHSVQLRTAVYELLYRLRDMEAGIYSVLQGVDNPDIRKRVDQAQAQIEPLLAILHGLTIDNPGQRARLDALEAVVGHRVDLMRLARRRHVAGDDKGAYRALGEAAEKFPYGDLAENIVQAESRLLTRRAEISAHRARTAWLVGTGTAVAQLLLLGLVVVLSERAIAKRLHAERISRQAVARAQRIVQTVREPMAVLDGQLRLLMVNAAFNELYGQTQGDRKHRLADVGEGAWAKDVLLQRLRDVIARDRELWDYELEQSTMDGVDRHMLINARRMTLPEGGEPAMLLSVSDVTSLVLAENRVSELNSQLERKLEQLSEVNHELEAFSYSVSHDLRAPLRHVAGFSDKLQRHLGRDIDEKTSHYLETIAGAARRMADLIDGLLVYSRLGRGSLRTTSVDMRALVEETRAMVMADAGDRDIEWRIGDLPTVTGDANMLRTVWQNLLGNAVKYTGKCEHAVIRVGAEKNGRGEYVFTVSDNGAGFDMAYADKLFGVFQRMHKDSEFPGSGVGLANVRRIVMRHDGRVWAEAELDKGASFHFSLPMRGT
ncbi:MAG TPA: ATP-binding protein [Rhodanobacteraceae bacterium]|nr:ATP-binding protein [Rhodanobacteraceae bacterium]